MLKFKRWYNYMYYFLFCLIFLLSSPSSGAVVLGQGLSSPRYPRGHSAMSGEIVYYHNFGREGGFSLAANEQKLVMLLNLLQYTTELLHP